MAYNYRPQSVEDIEKSKFPEEQKEDLKKLWKDLYSIKYLGNDNQPITLETNPNSLGLFKIHPKFKDLEGHTDKDYYNKYPSLMLSKNKKSHKKYLYGEGSAAGANKPPKMGTDIQELIQLRIFENFFGKKSPKKFPELVEEFKKIYPKIYDNKEWYDNFKFLYDKIYQTAGPLKSSSKFEIFNRNKGFMEFISKKVSKIGYPKKDTWNPADIWLIKNKTIQESYKNEIEKVMMEPKSDRAKIIDINQILIDAYKNKDIMGISLKKNNTKNLHYVENNINPLQKFNTLTNIKFVGYSTSVKYNWTTHMFGGVTSNYHFRLDLKNIEELPNINFAVRSNKTEIGDVTFEWREEGQEAQLGKVDKLDFIRITRKFYPGADLILNKEVPNTYDKTNKRWKDLETIQTFFKNKSNGLPSYKPNQEKFRAETIYDEMVDFYSHANKNEKNKTSSIAWQIIGYYFICSKIYNNEKKFLEYMKTLYYKAQKVGGIQKAGHKVLFGPFAKVY